MTGNRARSSHDTPASPGNALESAEPLNENRAVKGGVAHVTRRNWSVLSRSNHGRATSLEDLLRPVASDATHVSADMRAIACVLRYISAMAYSTHHLTMRDGVRIAVDVHVPDTARAPMPTLLHQTRYMRSVRWRGPFASLGIDRHLDSVYTTRKRFLLTTART